MLVIARHGRTAANAAGLLLGRADPALDETGRTQAAALGAALAGSGATRVVSSPLRRARETAEAVAVALAGVGTEVEVEIDERWIELDYGEYDGRPVQDVPAEVWQRWRSDAGYAPPGGESLRTLRRRVDAACGEWLEVGAAAPVVVVTHVSPVKAAVGWALGLDDQVNWRTFVAPASITRIRSGPVGPVLVSFNEVAHLDAPSASTATGSG